MAQENRLADVEPQSMDLYDDFVPGIQAGEYRFIVQQSALYTLPPGDEKAAPASHAYHYYRDRRFVVKGPRYSLGADDIHATFPPDGAAGSYRQSLPHVVLRKRALPWERSIWRAAGQEEPAPWLALLLLTQAELDSARQAFDHLDQPANPTSLLNTIAPADLFSAEPGLGPGLNGKPSLLPQLDRQRDGEGDEADHHGRVNVLDLPYETFRTACARRADLGYLAHVRCVSTAHTVPLGMHADGDFAVVMGNRFPQPGGNAAHLISLEGWGPVIEALDAAGHEPRADRVRLVVLASWTFADDEMGHHTFGGLVQNLEVRLFGAAAHDGKAPARAGDGDATSAYLEHGYVPVEYQPRQGPPSFAWYRGPFAPHAVKSLGPGALFASADAALVLDPQAGLLDVSYAAAWQLGRLLAVAAPSFAADLRLLLDLHRDRARAAAAAQDLARDLELERGAYGDLWRADLRDLMQALLAGQVDPAQREELVDGLTGAGLSREAAEAAVRAFQEAAGDQDLAARLAAAGLSAAQVADLMAIGHGPPPSAAEPRVMAGDELLRWLARLALLYPVPFVYLAAHERLLPPERLSFFYVDDNWVEALLDGSLSIALECGRDAATLGATRADFRKAVSKLVVQYRQHQRGLLDEWRPVGEAPDTYMDEVKTGFLLRSAAIAGWPGTQVRCFERVAVDGGQAQERPLALLRLDRLAPDVLLGITVGKIAKVVLEEPAEGIRFGVDTEGAVPLRHWRSDAVGSPIGAKLQDVHNAFARAGSAPGVLDIARLATELAGQVVARERLNEAVSAEFRSAAFALQMLRSPEMQTIVWE